MSKYLSLTITFKPLLQDEIVNHTFSYVKSYNKLFHNAQHLLISLNNKERCFFDFICEIMDDHNRIYADSVLKKKFLEHYSKIKNGGAEIKISHLTNYLKKLKELGLILEVNSRTYYYINPKYAFNGTSEKRLVVIKNIILERIKGNQPINHLIDRVFK